MTQNFQQDHELGWDDTIQNDSSEPVVLEPGDYIFEVEKFERARYTPGPNSKLPACNMAKLTLKVASEKGTAIVFNNLYLHTSTEGLLSAFFSSIGQKKKGEPLRMNWNMVTGFKGAVKIKNRTYNGNTYNDVDRFYPSDPSYYTTKEMPEIVKQLQQPAQSYQAAPQQTFNNQPQNQPQQGGFTPGAF
ncbi:TPA: hypothetical protein QFP73_001596 [Enterococcus faecium]